MAKRVLSIVIGTEITKICEISYRKNYQNKGIRVYRCVTYPTPPGSIEDGFIKDMDSFSAELKNQLRIGKFKSDKVLFSINSSKIANREIVLPPTREKKIMEIIKTGAADYFPINIKEYILSYQILEKNTSVRKEKALQKKLAKKELQLTKHQDKLNKALNKKKSKTELIAEKMEYMETSAVVGNASIDTEEKSDKKIFTEKRHIRVAIYAVPSALVKNYYSFAKALHMDIVSLDYSGNSSYQLIKRQAKRGTNIFVQVNEQDTLISILRDDILILQRTVGYGLAALLDTVLEQNYYPVKDHTEALQLLENNNLLVAQMNSQQSDRPAFDLSSIEAAATSELLQNMHQNNAEIEQEQYARRNIMDSLHFLTNSIVRMLDYYRSSHKNINVNTVYLLGVGAHIQGLEQFFTLDIGLTTIRMDKLWAVSSKKKATVYRKNPGEYIPCIGAVLNPVGFVPLEFIERRQKRSAIIATAFFMLACLAGSAGVIYIGYTDYQTANDKKEKLMVTLSSIPQMDEAQAEYEQTLLELADLEKFGQLTKSENDNITAIIEALEDNLPTQTVINTMQFSQSGVSMSVTAKSNNTVGANALVAKLLVQLKTIEYFKAVDVSGISVQGQDALSNITFTINCTYAD